MSIAANDYSTTRTILTKDNSCNATKFCLSAGKFKLISDGFYSAIDVIKDQSTLMANVGIDMSSLSRTGILSKVSNITGSLYGGATVPNGGYWMPGSITSTNYSRQANYYIMRTVNNSNTHAGSENIAIIKFEYNFESGEVEVYTDGYYYPTSGDPSRCSPRPSWSAPTGSDDDIGTMNVGAKSINWSFDNFNVVMSPTGLCWVAVP